MEDIQRQLDENKSEHKEIMLDMKDIKNDIGSIKILIAELPEKFDARYAPKKLESWFYAGVGVVLLAVLTSLLALILK